MSVHIYSQANGSLYTFQLGRKTCIFKYIEIPDTFFHLVDTPTRRGNEIEPLTYWKTDKYISDSIDSFRTIKYLKLIDTIENRIEIKHPSTFSTHYHIEVEMSYSDFLSLLKSKFELKNPQRNFSVYSFNIYYESADTGGLIKIKYPLSVEEVISKLNCLSKGGLILLSLKATEQEDIFIDTYGSSWLALIHIKN